MLLRFTECHLSLYTLDGLVRVYVNNVNTDTCVIFLGPSEENAVDFARHTDPLPSCMFDDDVPSLLPSLIVAFQEFKGWPEGPLSHLYSPERVSILSAASHIETRWVAHSQAAWLFGHRLLLTQYHLVLIGPGIKVGICQAVISTCTANTQ